MNELNKGIINKCKEENIDFRTCMGYLYAWYIPNYIKASKGLKTLYRLKGNIDYNSIYTVKNIVQSDFKYGEKHYIYFAEERLNKAKEILFSYLDKLKEPYYFILSQLREYNTYVFKNGFGVYDIECTGLDNLNIAQDYAMYKLGYK